jgi:PAS domain S-box-containing protein
MNSESKVIPFFRVVVPNPGASNLTTGSPRSRIVIGKHKLPAAAAQLLQRRQRPSYEELFRFFNESVDLLCIAGFDGRFKQLNPAWQVALQWTVQELLARPFIDFVHPEDRPATLAEMEKLVAGATTITFENRYHRKDGSWKWLQWTAAPLPGRQEIYAVARDVTLQKEVEKEILDAQDRERERVGRDLHDSLGPHLAAIGYAASFLTNDLRRRDQPEAAQAEKICEMVGEAMSHAHDLARGLFPAQMTGPVLSLALQDLARTTSNLRGVAVSFHEQGDTEITALNDGMHLYRIAQEAVNNAAKHGGATRVTIILSRDENSLRLAVIDDGKGMDPSQGEKGGIGLPSMRHRAQALGGELRIESNPGGGTIVSCEIPNHPLQPATPAP